MAKHLRITGLVQGVGYRAAFLRQAQSLGLAGWVRNRHDGSVEALVAGEAAGLERMTAWARRGPSAARVDAVTVEDVADGDVDARRMEMRPTA